MIMNMGLFSDLSNMVRGANDDSHFIVRSYDSVEEAVMITQNFLKRVLEAHHSQTNGVDK